MLKESGDPVLVTATDCGGGRLPGLPVNDIELVERLKDPPEDVGLTTWTVPCTDCEEQR